MTAATALTTVATLPPRTASMMTPDELRTAITREPFNLNNRRYVIDHYTLHGNVWIDGAIGDFNAESEAIDGATVVSISPDEFSGVYDRLTKKYTFIFDPYRNSMSSRAPIPAAVAEYWTPRAASGLAAEFARLAEACAAAVDEVGEKLQNYEEDFQPFADALQKNEDANEALVDFIFRADVRRIIEAALEGKSRLIRRPTHAPIDWDAVNGWTAEAEKIIEPSTPAPAPSAAPQATGTAKPTRTPKPTKPQLVLLQAMADFNLHIRSRDGNVWIEDALDRQSYQYQRIHWRAIDGLVRAAQWLDVTPLKHGYRYDVNDAGRAALDAAKASAK